MSNTISKAAKAAAVMFNASNVEGYEQAVEIFDAIQDGDKTISEVLEEHDVEVWSAVSSMEQDEWWDNVFSLAMSFQNATAHFEEQK